MPFNNSGREVRDLLHHPPRCRHTMPSKRGQGLPTKLGQILQSESDQADEIAKLWWVAGAWPLLLKELVSGSPICRYGAAWSVWNLMGILNEPVGKDIVAPLVALLDNGLADAKEAGAGALGNVVANTNKANASVAAAAGAIPLLIDLIDHAPMGAKEAAATALCNILLVDSDQQQIVAKCGGVGALLHAVHMGTPSVQLEAVDALHALILNCPKNVRSLQAAGGEEILKSVATCMDPPTSQDVKRVVDRVLSLVALSVKAKADSPVEVLNAAPSVSI